MNERVNAYARPGGSGRQADITLLTCIFLLDQRDRQEAVESRGAAAMHNTASMPSASRVEFR
jgi:hypothetical protein